MNLSPADRAVVMSLCPLPLEEVAEADVDSILDQWFHEDHYDDNPAYDYVNELDDEGFDR